MMRTLSATTWLIAMLFIVGCANDSTLDEASQYEIMDVNNLWQDSVPVEYVNSWTLCRISNEPNLLIPYFVSADSPLQIEVYACSQDFYGSGCSGKTFKEARFDKDDKKVTVSLWQGNFTQDECGGIFGGLEKLHTFEVNGPWQRGELEVVVENSDGELTGFVTVE